MFTGHRIGMAAMLAVAVTGCGGGGSGAGLAGAGPGGGFDTGIGGSGGLVGSVQSFGSVIVNDVVMEIDDAQFTIEGERAGVGLVGQNLLREGQHLTIIGDVNAGLAGEVIYRSDLQAPVEVAPVFDPLTGAGELTVLGQVVKTRALTRFASGTSLETLQAGDVVEVSGTRDASGALVATYMERRDALDRYKVVGRVSAVSAPGFTIGNLTVDTQSAGIVNPAVGELVEVVIDADGFTAGQPVVGLRVEPLDDLDVVEGGRLEVEGFIDTFASSSRFTVGGFPVSVDEPVDFERGEADDLELNARIEVEGSVSASGRLLAERIVFKPTEAIRVEGRVAPGGIDLVARTVTTDVGVTFVVRALTELEDESASDVSPLTLEDLAPGDVVEVRGFLDGARVIAAGIEREDADPDAETRLRAPADAAPVVAADGTVELLLLGIAVTGDRSSTRYEGDDDGILSQAAFVELVDGGTVVEATWNAFTDVSQRVDVLAIEEEDD